MKYSEFIMARKKYAFYSVFLASTIVLIVYYLKPMNNGRLSFLIFKTPNLFNKGGRNTFTTTSNSLNFSYGPLTLQKLSFLKEQKLKFQLKQRAKVKEKVILFWKTFYGVSSPEAYCIEEDNGMDFCEYKCEYVFDEDEESVKRSDAIVFHGREDGNTIEGPLPKFRSPNQRWVFLMFESPQNTFSNFAHWKNLFNWTMSYRDDSDVYIPYGNLISTKEIITNSEEEGSGKESFGSKRLAAWAVSNCDDRFVKSDRKGVIDELSAYIPIDIYGACGLYQCPGRSKKQCSDPQKCFKYLGHRYKFYFSLENSMCEDYITEKFFNALQYGMLPIVLGSSKESYLKHAPPNSFIHIDDYDNLEDLAKYISFLDQNDEEYSKYFLWKLEYSVNPVLYFQNAWCSLCKKLHTSNESNEKNVYKDLGRWWYYKNGQKVCDSVT